MGWDRVRDDMGMRENTGYRGQMDKVWPCVPPQPLGLNHHRCTSLNRADADPMIWIVFLGARSEIPNLDFNALDLNPFPLLCHLLTLP